MRNIDFLNKAKLITNINYEPDILPEVNVEVKKDIDSILDLIYTTDPVSGLPRGDLAQFLSDKTNPQVRLFIEQNLMNEHPDNGSVSSSVLPPDIVNKYRGVITDDDIVRYTRNDGESVSDYAKRMQDEITEQRRQFYFKRKFAKLEKKLRDSE